MNKTLKKMIIPFTVSTALIGSLAFSNDNSNTTYANGIKITDDTKGADNVTIINYHAFYEAGEQPQIDNINITPKRFEEQLKALKAHGYNTITEQELIDYMNGKLRLPEKSVFLTIDDGYSSVYEHAYPLLKKYDYNAILFPIISDMEIGTRKNAPMITFEQMNEMAQSDVIEIGNHSYNLHWRGNNDSSGHEAMKVNYDINGKHFANVTERMNNIADDLKKAHTSILDTTGIAPKSYSIPYGAYDSVALQAIEQAGYDVTYTTHSGTNVAHNSTALLKRYDSSEKITAESLINNLKKEEVKTYNSLGKIHGDVTSVKPSGDKDVITMQYTFNDKKDVISVHAELYEMNGDYRGDYLGTLSEPSVPKLLSKSKSVTEVEPLKSNKEYAVKTIVRYKNGDRYVVWNYFTR